MKKVVIFLGVPGSGKGTQAKRLTARYAYQHISTGNLLRALNEDSNANLVDKQKLEDMKVGKLVSNDLIYKLAFQAIVKAFEENKGVILDGAIRNVEQAKAYNIFLNEQGITNSDIVVVHITLSDKTSFLRLTKRKICESCNYIIPYSPENKKIEICSNCSGKLIIRMDDSPEIIKKRIQEQGSVAIQPIVDYYKEMGVLYEVNGEQRIEKVDREIEKIIV